MGIPEVSGVSPKEGKPGTKVTIRGENLGNNKDDIECELLYYELVFSTTTTILIIQPSPYVGRVARSHWNM